MAVATRRKVSAEIHMIQVTAPDITAQYLYLPGTLPDDPSKITVDIVALGPQILNVDYQILFDGRLYWAAMGLGTILSSGDTIRVIYHY